MRTLGPKLFHGQDSLAFDAFLKTLLFKNYPLSIDSFTPNSFRSPTIRRSPLTEARTILVYLACCYERYATQHAKLFWMRNSRVSRHMFILWLPWRGSTSPQPHPFLESYGHRTVLQYRMPARAKRQSSSLRHTPRHGDRPRPPCKHRRRSSDRVAYPFDRSPTDSPVLACWERTQGE